MPKLKALLFTVLVLALSFSLIGCGMLTSFTSSEEEVVEVGGQVPEWLMLSYRSIASEDNDIDEDLAAIDEDEEQEEAVGGLDEDDGVTAGSENGDSDQAEQATSEVAQAADSGSTGSSQQESTTQQEPTGSDPVSEWLARLTPGTQEYNHYLQHRKDRHETPEEFVRRALKAKEEAEKKEAQGDMMGNWDHSPSGWGSSDDDD